VNRKGFTLIEISVVTVIIGILASLAVARYQKVSEKARATEAEMIMEKVRAGYQARVFETLSIATGGAWNPNIGLASDASWRALGMANPNAPAGAFFAYDYWDAATSAGSAPVSAARNVVVAFRRTTQAAYSNVYDATKWLYMDLDTGRVVKSDFYR
jgi:prepilin-type N-terminal cleavage/methylation domain-containing protein